MCITEDKLVESYGKATPRERFRLIYKNYSIFPQLVDCYETGLFNRILFEVEYNRRKKNDDDLGVRIQTSHRSDPTAAKAIEHIMIRDAIEECNFSGNILKETDTPGKHKRDILTIHMMRREFEVFETSYAPAAFFSAVRKSFSARCFSALFGLSTLLNLPTDYLLLHYLEQSIANYSPCHLIWAVLLS